MVSMLITSLQLYSTLGLGNISILLPLRNIRVCNINIADIFSEANNIAFAIYCNISPNTTIGLSVQTKFTLTNNTESHRSLLLEKCLDQLLLDLCTYDMC